jgi:hypothetical protein
MVLVSPPSVPRVYDGAGWVNWRGDRGREAWGSACPASTETKVSCQRDVDGKGACLRRPMGISTLWAGAVRPVCSRVLLAEALKLPLLSAAAALLAPS